MFRFAGLERNRNRSCTFAMEPLSLDRRVQRGQLSPAQLFRRMSLFRRLLLISHHESETLFRVFSLCASMNRLPTFFFTPPCMPRLAWLRPFWPKFFETRGLTSQQIGFLLAPS